MLETRPRLHSLLFESITIRNTEGWFSCPSIDFQINTVGFHAFRAVLRFIVLASTRMKTPRPPHAQRRVSYVNF